MAARLTFPRPRAPAPRPSPRSAAHAPSGKFSTGSRIAQVVLYEAFEGPVMPCAKTQLPAADNAPTFLEKPGAHPRDGPRPQPCPQSLSGAVQRSPFLRQLVRPLRHLCRRLHPISRPAVAGPDLAFRGQRASGAWMAACTSWRAGDAAVGARQGGPIPVQRRAPRGSNSKTDRSVPCISRMATPHPCRTDRPQRRPQGAGRRPFQATQPPPARAPAKGGRGHAALSAFGLGLRATLRRGWKLAHQQRSFSAPTPKREFDDLAAGRMPRGRHALCLRAGSAGADTPTGPERFEIILNGPPGHPSTPEDAYRCRTHTFETLARMGLRFSPTPDITA